ncbi:hypothetical protein MP228_001716 [Amoeboaphelidium protococcarum]|nr:hypothetical protein MP228_001716 [Amoeboaphelidium protococcarum]
MIECSYKKFVQFINDNVSMLNVLKPGVAVVVDYDYQNHSRVQFTNSAQLNRASTWELYVKHVDIKHQDESLKFLYDVSKYEQEYRRFQRILSKHTAAQDVGDVPIDLTCAQDDQDLAIDCNLTNSCSRSSIIGMFSSSTQSTVSIGNSMQQPSSYLTLAIGRATLTINQSVRSDETSASIASDSLQMMFELIVQKYIEPGGEMELNISSKERSRIQNLRVSQGIPESSVFKKLRDDVLVSLYQSSWRTFWMLQNTQSHDQ